MPQEMDGRQPSDPEELPLCLQAVPPRAQHLSATLGQVSGSRFSWKCRPSGELCEGSRLCVPYENLTPKLPLPLSSETFCSVK